MSEPLRQAAERAFDSWMAAVTNHLATAGVPDEVAGELAALFVATIEGMFVLCRTSRSTAPLAAAGRHLAALVDAALAEALSR